MAKQESQKPGKTFLDELFGNELHPFASKDELVNNAIRFEVQEINERESPSFGTTEWALTISFPDTPEREWELLSMTKTAGPRDEKLTKLQEHISTDPNPKRGPFILKAIAVKKGTLHYIHYVGGK